MKEFLFRWAATTFGVLIATGVVLGITFESASSLIWAGLLLGILNAVVRPVILLLALPVVVLTLGLFIPIVNALLLHWVGGGWIAGFHVDGFGAAFLGGIVVSIAGWAFDQLFSNRRAVRVRVRTFPAAPPFQPPPQPGEMKRVEGRVIDPDEKP